jgi:hypothetical protein
MNKEYREIYKSISGTYNQKMNRLMALSRRMLRSISEDETDYYWECATYSFWAINESLNVIKSHNYLHMGRNQFKKVVKRFQHICKNTDRKSYKQLDEEFRELYIDMAIMLDKKKYQGRMWGNPQNTERELLRLFYEYEKCDNIINHFVLPPC